MINMIKRWVSNANDSSSEVANHRNQPRNSVPPPSKKRKSFPVVEIALPASRTPSRTESDRSATPPTVYRQSQSRSHVNGIVSGRHAARDYTPPFDQSLSPELPPSPPKRTRFDDNIQYQEIRPYKPERASFAYKSPDRRVSSNIKSTSAKSSTKRKRRASDEGEEDTSVELEVPPTTSPKPHKAADILSILGTPIDLPSFRPNGSGSKKANGYQALPGSSRIQNKGPSVIEIDEDDEDTSDSRSVSPELPEILPHHSAKKVDVKGKGRAVDLPPEDSKGEKVMRVPIEAKFRSLEELADFEPDVRPTYALWVLARCAILGSGIERLTLDGIISRIAGKYLYYKYLAYDSGSEERSRFANALKGAMKTKACFTVTKEAGLREWFGVDIKINPALKKEPQRRKASLPIFEETAGSEMGLRLNGSTSRLDGPVTYVSSSLPQHRAIAPVPLKSVPPVPPPPKQPEYTIQRPQKVPSAEVEIFATSLMDLKNAPPLDDEPSPLGEQKEADKDKPAASSKVNHLDVLGKRIGYELWVPLRAALLGSPFRKLKVNAIIQDLLWKYPQLAPKDQPDSQKKLAKAIKIFNGSNKHASFWMVDPSIDPRQITRRSKMKPRPSAASGADHQMVTSLDLAMSMSLPPSNLLGISGSTPDPASGIISSDFLMDMNNDLKDLKELENFYTERASIWLRRMAYVHESEVIVKTAMPDPVPEITRARSESPAGDDMAVEKSPSPELEEVVSPRKRLSPATAVGFDKSVPDGLKALPKVVKTAHPLSREVEPEDSDDSDTGVPPPPIRSAAPATYVCGYALGRAGIICETRLSSQEERMTHQRFVHGVRASSSHKDKFLQEAKIKMQKQMEQERINKKMGQKGKKKLDSGVSGMSLHARMAATGKALASASGHRRS